MATKVMRARTEALSVQSVGEELLILDQQAGKIHQLNPTASLIWRKCVAGVSLQEMARSLVESFEIGEEVATRDVVDTVEKLQALNLVCVE
jgi:hypothetical protein